jgi:hypothetical protein
MKLKANVIGALLVIALPCLATAQYPSFAGVVSIDSVTVAAGSHVAVPIRLAGNNMAIAGLQIPLQFEGAYLSVDSITYGGTIKPTTMEASTRIDNNNDTISIIFYPNVLNYPFPSLSSSSGVLAVLHLTVDQAAPEGVITIDSIYHTSTMWTGTGFSNGDGVMFMPAAFVPGRIVVAMPTAVDDQFSQGLPATFGLSQNYPNPFNPVTTIEFALPRAGHTTVEVFNILGQRVVTLLSQPMDAGYHQVEYDAGNQPSGIYFYRITHPLGTQTKKMTLLK